MKDLIPKNLLNSPVVLITGETGTGKSVFAKKIFNNSKCNNQKFVTAHLASISEQLIESELFGHEKGAFSGAVSTKKGYIEQANFGTLFLDEIGELSLNAQKKLLYLFEEKKYCKVGSTIAQNFSGKIIAATNMDLEKKVAEGKFREDLYYRLLMSRKEMVPLRDKIDRIKDYINTISIELARKYSSPPIKFQYSFYNWCREYSWNGNMRELKNTIEYFYLEELISVDKKSLPKWLINSKKVVPIKAKRNNYSYYAFLEKCEKTYFKEVLEHFEGKVNETARQIGISKSTLIAKIKKYGINTFQIKADYRQVL